MLRLVLASVLLSFISLPISKVSEAQMIIAHRGASGDAPENTLGAFDLAWKQNADGIEGDFYLTSDSEIVCIHDADTMRTTGRKLIVKDSTLTELRELDAGSWKGSDWVGQRIPTFAEVLATVPQGKRLVVEIKCDEKIVPVLKNQLAKLDHSPIEILFISFDEQVIIDCKKMMPEIPANWLTGFKEGRPTATEIAGVATRCGCEGVGLQANRDLIDRVFVEQLKQNGCGGFHVWTVNTVDDAKYFQSLGATGITTNWPGKIQNEIKLIAGETKQR